MQTILLHDELSALIRQCQIVLETEEVYLSFRQEEWLLDMIEHRKKDRLHKIVNKGVEFMFQILAGKYGRCPMMC